MNKCVHVDFSLYMGKGIFYFLLFFCRMHKGKKPKGRQNKLEKWNDKKN